MRHAPGSSPSPSKAPAAEAYSTVDVARLLGLAVRSVQLMVDRGELQAWKTPGGHRRISRASVEQWMSAHGRQPLSPQPSAGRGRRAAEQPPQAAQTTQGQRPKVLLIEDSKHFQNLVTLLVQRHFPEVDLQAADDGIVGLAMVGRWNPDVLLIDILLPGMDGATLVTGLRSHPEFAHCALVIVTSLQDEELAPYRFALEGLPLVHKNRLVTDLPTVLQQALTRVAHGATDARNPA